MFSKKPVAPAPEFDAVSALAPPEHEMSTPVPVAAVISSPVPVPATVMVCPGPFGVLFWTVSVGIVELKLVAWIALFPAA